MPANKEPVSVLGAGSWGTALAIRLARNHNDTCLWGHTPAFMETLARERENSQYLPGTGFPDRLTVETDLARAIGIGRDLLIVLIQDFSCFLLAVLADQRLG